jgi:hypothetical protein
LRCVDTRRGVCYFAKYILELRERMENSSSPTAAGVLSIVSGVFGVLMGTGMILFAVFFISLVSFEAATEIEDFPFVIFEALYLGWGIFTLLLAVLAIIGGIYALQRRHWGLALAGSIASILVFFPTGIAAVIFVALSRNEFDQNSSSP